MPWCPKCKNEYYEGIKVCADCGTELVDSLEEWEKTERKAREADLREQLAAYREMLAGETESDGEDAEDGAEPAEYSEGVENLGGGDAENMKDAALCGDAGEAEDPDKPGKGQTEQKRKPGERHQGVYQNYEEKAADNKSSAYTLLGVGAIGVVAILLCFLDVIKLPLNASSKVVILGVLGAMFLFFVVMGVVSMKNAGKYAKKAESEKELTKELEKWFVEYVTAEKIDDGLFSEEETELREEQKYFKRFDRMKELLSERFINLNEGYVDRFLDKHYQDIFGEDKN